MKDKIKSHWDKIAKQLGTNPKANMADQVVVKKENNALLAYIRDGDNVLDIGCANGTSTLWLAKKKKIYIKGIDISEEMITKAIQKRNDLLENNRINGKVDFAVQDITQRYCDKMLYEKIISKRAIINLTNWDMQLKAIRSLSQFLKRDGLIVLVEDSIQSWKKLNELRSEWGLEEIPVPWHNQYIDEDKIINETKDIFELIEIRDFCSTYYIGSRFVQPLLLKLLNIDREPQYEAKINYLFAELPDYGSYGFQRIFVFKKNDSKLSASND